MLATVSRMRPRNARKRSESTSGRPRADARHVRTASQSGVSHGLHFLSWWYEDDPSCPCRDISSPYRIPITQFVRDAPSGYDPRSSLGAKIMSSLDVLDVKREVSSLLSKCDTKSVFDSLVQSIMYHYERPVHSLTELKKRDLKTSVGTTWERFCALWLLHEGRYTAVWTISEWLDHVDSEGLGKTYQLKRQDNGIDLIAQSERGYHAVQCKWRKKGRVTWSTLSTFIGLCARTGPWTTQIVMTNAPGITSKVPRTKRDVSLCQGTFRSTSREHWLKMVGLYEENRVSDEASSSAPEPSLDEMRAARLLRFAN